VSLLDSIVEFHIGDDFWQLVLAGETASNFLCTLDKLEHHGECGLVRQAALRADRSAKDSYCLARRQSNEIGFHFYSLRVGCNTFNYLSKPYRCSTCSRAPLHQRCHAMFPSWSGE
jgi:hypothetical protein